MVFMFTWLSCGLSFNANSRDSISWLYSKYPNHVTSYYVQPCVAVHVAVHV